MKSFNEWLEAQDPFRKPVVAWGPDHTRLAEAYARDVAAEELRKSAECMSQALNEGDGVYRP